MSDFERTIVKTQRGDIIPLIDVALFLLIFFMVAGTIEKFELIPIEVPVAESGKLLDEGHIVILLGTHDEIVMDDTLLALDELKSALTEQLKLNPDKVITLKADSSVPAVKMIEVMDTIKLAGGTNLSLVTQSKPQESGE